MRKLMIVLVAILMAAMTGCGDKVLELKIRYNAIHGLVSGAQVWFEQNTIGSVAKVEYTPEGSYLVHVHIAKEFQAAVTEYARFFIIPDPQTPKTSAMEVIQTQKGGQPLQNGTTIPGATKTSAHLDRLMGQLAEGIEEVQRRWTSVLEDLHTLPEKEAYNSLEAELGRLDKEIDRSTEKARRELQENVLPKIEQGIILLKKRLGQAGREAETEPLEQKLKELQESE